MNKIFETEKNTFLASFKAEFDVTSNLTVAANYSTQHNNTFQEYFTKMILGGEVLLKMVLLKEIIMMSNLIHQLTATYKGQLNDLNMKFLGLCVSRVHFPRSIFS